MSSSPYRLPHASLHVPPPRVVLLSHLRHATCYTSSPLSPSSLTSSSSSLSVSFLSAAYHPRLAPCRSLWPEPSCCAGCLSSQRDSSGSTTGVKTLPPLQVPLCESGSLIKPADPVINNSPPPDAHYCSDAIVEWTHSSRGNAEKSASARVPLAHQQARRSRRGRRERKEGRSATPTCLVVTQDASTPGVHRLWLTARTCHLSPPKCLLPRHPLWERLHGAPASSTLSLWTRPPSATRTKSRFQTSSRPRLRPAASRLTPRAPAGRTRPRPTTPTLVSRSGREDITGGQ